MTANSISRIKIGGAALAIAAALALAGALAAQGQETEGVAFPVAELGNCASKNACRAYCNEPGNMPACIAFAKEHGLMNEEEAARAEEFQGALEEGGGPGGCRTPEACKAFCEDVANIEVCIAFAEEHGFRDSDFEEGKKIRDYLRSGGAMPGGCTSKTSCEAYCGDFSHGEECLEFAGRAGIAPGGPEGRGPGRGPENPEQIKRVIELMKRGETPGGCASREACETYCRDDGHFEECISFAEKAGFMKPGEAERVRKTGGKGPGGCKSREECDAYCNDAAHREECFKFAEEHGFIEKEEIEKIKGGLVQLRAGLEQAPQEVRECVESVLGVDAIAGIQSGERLPGPEVGEQIRACFEKFGQRGDGREMFKRIPPEMGSCLKEKLGDALSKLQEGELEPTPEIADALRVCHQSVQFEKGNFGGGEGGPGGAPGGSMGGGPENMQMFLRGAPQGIAACFREKLGEDFAPLESGELREMTPAMRERMKECFESFVPPGGEFGPGPGMENRMQEGPFPPRPLPLQQQQQPQQPWQPLEGSAPQPPAVPGGSFPGPEGEQIVKPLCSDEESCRRLCTDSSGQFFSYPECARFRDAVNLLETLRGEELPPPASSLPTDNACPDLVTCAARCANEASPYFLKAECVQYREQNPPSGASLRSLFWSNVLMNLKALFRGGKL